MSETKPRVYYVPEDVLNPASGRGVRAEYIPEVALVEKSAYDAVVAELEQRLELSFKFNAELEQQLDKQHHAYLSACAESDHYKAKAEKLTRVNEQLSTVDKVAIGDIMLKNDKYKAALERIADVNTLGDTEPWTIAREALAEGDE